MKLALLAVAAAAAAASGTGLKQVQCISPARGCTHAVAVSRPAGVAHYGNTVYVRSGVGSLGSLGVFARDPRTGRLRQLQCLARRAKPCADGRGLETPAAIAFSPDGRSAYVAAQNGQSVGIYARAASGKLLSRGSVSGLAHPRALAVSRDGRQLYVGGDRLWVFARAASGALTPVETQPVGAQALAVSLDGTKVYAAAGGGYHGSLVVFDRDPATGTLTEAASASSPATPAIEQPAQLVAVRDGFYSVSTVSGAVALFDGGIGQQAVARRLPLASGLAVAPDRVYVAYRDGVAVFTRSLRRLGTERLAHATGVDAVGSSVFAASPGRVTAYRH